MVEVKNISKSYGKKDSRFKALQKINFSVDEGTTVAIIGKSGSGKSTLMHIMSGLDRPDSGEVVFGDVIVQKMSQKESDSFRANEMSFIFQSFFVEGNQTVYQNVSLPLEVMGTPRVSRKELVERALQKVELLDKINENGSNLSGGQKQRLAIARAIVGQPKIIFADEPTGNLDSATGDKIMNLLFNLSKNMGTSLFIVTHDEELANKCQVQIKLLDGKITKITKKSDKAKK